MSDREKHPSATLDNPSLGNVSNPFVSPEASRPTSGYASSAGAGAAGLSSSSNSAVGRSTSSSATSSDAVGPRFFHSRRVAKGSVEKPWLGKKDARERWVTILPLLGILAGLGLAGFLVWDGVNSVVKHKYCLVMDDEFGGGKLDSSKWNTEVQLGGFGNGEFGMTTTSETNLFVKDNHLFIKATPQNATLMETDNILNLLSLGTCTSNTTANCVAATNTTAGNYSTVPPAVTARINTKGKAQIKYGRVEVTAKLPKGDWLWPAIWMMPAVDTYGTWPASGEIDIMESRGNNYTYPQGGNNIVTSSLHWGPDSENDAWWKTSKRRTALHTTYADGFNTFGVEWSEKYIFTYVNTRLMQVMYTNFKTPFWKRGNFPSYNADGDRLVDPWSQTGRSQTPFDQEFFLILNVAVGSNNGWFEDSASKPWKNKADSAAKDFWAARNQWEPTWKQPQMEVSKVAMWQQCDGGEL
ncbi:hypothetical protein TD95_004245 [Thielaviopsis punctulata]|uniref:GH16 domain-containing protein n=1 Tax=Thielaviopsis punctulata TaxID=72032 RepID=A0A0F4Z7M9_9PEZI|nr:hypothetical protein TD95_004245 [Thielaviopsis punctulata]